MSGLSEGKNRTGTKVRDRAEAGDWVFRSVRRRRGVIDGRLTVDIVRDGLIVETMVHLFEIEKFGYSTPSVVPVAPAALYIDDMGASISAK